MNDAFICDAVRTPFGRYGGALSSVRADDLGALPIAALIARNPTVDWSAIDDVFYGCANQAGEDNRNVGRMAALLAGLPAAVPANTINRLCGSSLDAVGMAARSIKAGEAELIIAGAAVGDLLADGGIGAVVEEIALDVADAFGQLGPQLWVQRVIGIAFDLACGFGANEVLKLLGEVGVTDGVVINTHNAQAIAQQAVTAKVV